MSATSTEHSRRAVYAAVSRVFQDRLSQHQAMQFWESKFSSETIFHVSDFAAKLRDHVGLTDDQRRELMVSIFSALSKSESQLAPVPAVLRVANVNPVNDNIAAPPEEVESAPVATKKRKNPANVVFSSLLTKFISAIASRQKSTRGELQSVFIESLDSASIDSATGRQFERWAQGGFADESVPAIGNAGEMSVVVNALYVSLCDIAGPVMTDKALAKAVASTEELPESMNFSATSLL